MRSFYFFSLPLVFFFVPTTDLKRNNSCNYSVRLVLTILSSFFAYLSLLYSFAVCYFMPFLTVYGNEEQFPTD